MERQRWASFVFLCALLVSLQKGAVDRPPQTYSVALGAHKSVPLADSSDLQLNTGSLASAQITAQSRVVTLHRGEALLSIAADPRTFVVHVGSIDFETTSTTHAHIRVDPEGATRLDVLKGEGWIRSAAGAAARFEPLRVSAGSSFSLRYDVRIVERFDPGEMTRKLAWTQGQVILAGDSLADAVAEFNRYNRRQLVVGDERIANIATGGTFYVTEPDTFTRSLNKLFGIRAVRTRPDVVMLVGDSYAGL